MSRPASRAAAPDASAPPTLNRAARATIDTAALAHNLGVVRQAAPMFDVHVGEDANVLPAQPGAIPHCLRCRTFDQTLVCNISIGPLIDPDEAGLRSLRHCKRRQGSVRQNVDADRQGDLLAQPIRDHRHRRGRLRADTLRLGERDVAVVFHDQAVNAAIGIGARVGQGLVQDLRDRATGIIRRAR